MDPFKIVMAIGGAAHPGLGFIADVVDFVPSIEKNAGTKFIVSLASMALPGGFWVSLASGVAIDVFLSDDIGRAINSIIFPLPYELKCEQCGMMSNQTVKFGELTLCQVCVSEKIGSQIQQDDKIYILKNDIYRLNEELTNRYLLSQDMVGGELIGGDLIGGSL
jgi:hypothetical protein